jgi:hypothetical protein
MPDVSLDLKPYVPTKKWFAALVGGVATILVHAILSSGWDATENGELLALAGALATAYLKRNDPTIEGKVPASA